MRPVSRDSVPIKDWLAATNAAHEPVSEHTLRFWQKVGVLPHAEIRRGHVGYLSLALIARVTTIRKMMAYGTRLRDIARFLAHGLDKVQVMC